MDRSFDFNVILDEKEENSTFYETEDEFPDDVLVRQDSIMCYSSRGAHKHNYDQVRLLSWLSSTSLSERSSFLLPSTTDMEDQPFHFI